MRTQIKRAYDYASAQPLKADAVGQLGMVLHTYSEYDSAEQCYRRAELIEPKAFSWPYYLGLVQAAQGKNREAIQSFRRALERKPGEINAQLNLADSLASAGEFEESDQVYTEILKHHPDCAEAHYGLGRIHTARAQFQAAAEAFSKACKLFPAYGAAHYSLGLAYRNLGDEVQARRELALYQTFGARKPPRDDPLLETVEQANQNPQQMLKTAADLEHNGQLKRSADLQERALELDPRLILAHINLISLYARLGLLDQAQEHYQAGLLINPGHPELYNNYGVVLMMRHQYGKARAIFRKVLEISPTHVKAHMNLGLLAEQQGRVEEALTYYKKAVEIQPNDAVGQFKLGSLLLEKNDYAGAEAHFLRALALEEAGRAEMLSSIAAVYKQNGNAECAREFARMAKQAGFDMQFD